MPRVWVRILVHEASGFQDRQGADRSGFFVRVAFGDDAGAAKYSERCSLLPDGPSEGLTVEAENESELQEYPVRVGLCSEDNGTPDFGVVSIDLEQILQAHKNRIVDDAAINVKGWFPLFDTMSGIRGKILVSVGMQFAWDRADQDNLLPSVGVRFFSSSIPTPSVLSVEQLHGLVSVVLVVQDPDHEWMDRLRSDRKSNEARLCVFSSAAMQARHQLSRKVQQQGANAVLGYREYVDLEGGAAKTICIRAFGTSAQLMTGVPDVSCPVFTLPPPMPSSPSGSSSSVPHDGGSPPRMPATPGVSILESLQPLQRAASDRIHATPSGLRLLRGASEPPPRSVHNSPGEDCRDQIPDRSLLKRDSIHALNRLPVHSQVAIGGVVAARAVKIIDERTTADEREAWWTELREELIGHAKHAGCDSVAGYDENISIVDDLALLSVMGTAISCKPTTAGLCGPVGMCAAVHAQEGRRDMTRLERCRLCCSGFVPSVLMATIDFPEGLPVIGCSELVEARVCRLKRRIGDDRGSSARSSKAERRSFRLSEALPFLELELHKQLMYKMRLMGLNAAFGLRVEISHGQDLLVGVATATAILVPALPLPGLLRIKPGCYEVQSAETCERKIFPQFSGDVSPIASPVLSHARSPTRARTNAENSTWKRQVRPLTSVPMKWLGFGHAAQAAAVGNPLPPRLAAKQRPSPSARQLAGSMRMLVLRRILGCPARCPRNIRRWFRAAVDNVGELGSESNSLTSDVASPHEGEALSIQDLCDRLNTAVDWHCKRREVNDGAATFADSFDWPWERLLTLIELSASDSAAPSEAEGPSDQTPDVGGCMRRQDSGQRSASKDFSFLPLQDRGVLHVSPSKDIPPSPSGSAFKEFPPLLLSDRGSLHRSTSKDIPPSPGGSGLRLSERERRRLSSSNSAIASGVSSTIRDPDTRQPLAMDIDDEADKHLWLLIDDPLVPDPISLSTVECVPGSTQAFQAVNCKDPQYKIMHHVRRVHLFKDLGLDQKACTATPSTHAVSELTRRLSEVLNETYSAVVFRQLENHSPDSVPKCNLASLSWRISVQDKEEDVIELVLTGQMLCAAPSSAIGRDCPADVLGQLPPTKAPSWQSGHSAGSGQPGSVRFLVAHGASQLSRVSESPQEFAQRSDASRECHTEQVVVDVPKSPVTSMPSSHRQDTSPEFGASHATTSSSTSAENCPASVLVSALSSVPHKKVERYCCLVTVQLIRETRNRARDFELSAFYQEFVDEALEIARAHVRILGGNALLGYRINSHKLERWDESQDRQHNYAILSISGDAVKLSRGNV